MQPQHHASIPKTVINNRQRRGMVARVPEGDVSIYEAGGSHELTAEGEQLAKENAEAVNERYEEEQEDKRIKAEEAKEAHKEHEEEIAEAAQEHREQEQEAAQEAAEIAAEAAE